ncbi:probable disease resistance protein At4g27220 [Morus notabilis]|uniref:probable disease resistance protein At4g27220 n=1 Tax=Morus notabilis TaxID=981085 RepID=UPI000CED45D8|nr:probable disease resistance protein At4g27220 [Morus notabilis]
MKITQRQDARVTMGHFRICCHDISLAGKQRRCASYEVFESRVQTLREIIEALKDINTRMIGIYGMGGIGKTMLAKEVAGIAKEEKLFDKVAFTIVSQTPDVYSIQQEIAEQVGLEKFHEIKSQIVRAERLRHRLSQEKNILVILDDVWKELNLSAVGIDFDDDQKGCRILLTSRSLNVLQDHMGADRNMEIKVLWNIEAMDLFKKNAGISNENVKFQPLVRDIVKECAGLPIAITTVAHALKNKSLSIWEDALLQLKRSIATNIEGIDQKVYASIKLSYDFLEGDDEAKSLLLLCSLHGEDAIIKVEDLMIYGVGWGLFREVYTVEEARNRVDSIVNKLKLRCLLLDGGFDGTAVKVHDIIRDVMLSIASEDRQMHNIANIQKFDQEISPKKRLTDSIAISLFVGQDDNKLPEKLDCPQLELFLVFGESRNHLQIPEQYFEEKKELKVLRLNKVHAGLLPTSFSLLQNLQALSLYRCMGKVTLIGELKNLKMLDLSFSKIEELPKHIGQLTHLQMLTLNYCERLEVIQPGVISSLLRLEELHMKGVPLKWEAEGVHGERSNASLVELKTLPLLSTVCLSIADINVLPKALFSEKLKRFELSIGMPYDPHIVKSEFKNHNSLHLTLSGHNLTSEYGLEVIIKRSEVLYLYGFAGVNNVVYELNEEGFRQVKSFGFGDNNDVQYVVNATGTQPCSVFQNLEQLCLVRLMNLEKIYCGKLTAQSFGKLRFITVEGCDRLKNLFSSSIARKFEEITVTNCKVMKEIVVHEIEHDAHNSADKIEFLELRSLILKDLPELVDFFRSEMETHEIEHDAHNSADKIEFLELRSLILKDLPELVDFFRSEMETSCVPSLGDLGIIRNEIQRLVLRPTSNNFSLAELNEAVGVRMQ